MNTEVTRTIITILVAVLGGLLLLWGAGTVLGFVFKHWITLLVVVGVIVVGAIALAMQRK
jgi:hypothetical protein